MRSQSNCIRMWSVLSACILFSAFTASAANGTWNSTAPGSNGFWTNSLNWSASPYPVNNDTASFTNAGNGQTLVDVTGLTSIKYITYDSPSVAAYTNGTGAVNSQALVMADGGEFKVSGTAGNSQVFNCGVQLGLDRNGLSYSFRNDSVAQSLIFNDVFCCGPEVTSGAGTKTLTVNGAGVVSILGNVRPNGASGLTLTHANSSLLTLAGTNAITTVNMNAGPLTLLGSNVITTLNMNAGALTLLGSNVITTLNMNYGPNSVVDIGSNELFLSSGGGNVLNCTQGGVINGTGKIRMSTTDTIANTGYNYADCSVSAGKTLVINPEITGLGGFEMWSGTGTFVLNGTNTFEAHICFGTVGAISVSRIGNRGSITSNFGKGTNLYFNAAGAKLIYTGTGEDSNRQILLNNNATIDQSGPSAKLSFSVSPTLLAASRTLTLQGSTDGVGEFSAALVNSGSYLLSLIKAGTGTWIFSGTNTYTGTTAVNAGKLLVNSPGSLASGSAVTVSTGAILGGNGSVFGTVTLNAGGMLAPGDINTVGTLRLTNTVSLTSSTLFFDITTADALNVVTDKVEVGRTLTTTGTNTIVVTFPNGSAPAGSYTLMTFPSRTGTGTFVLSPEYPNMSIFTNATTVRLDVGPGGAYATTWTGVESSNWDGTELNWTNGSAAVAFAPGDAVAFGDSALRFTVGSALPVIPGSVLFNNSVNNYAVSAAIDGTGVVYKLGSGNVTLTGANTYTGQTTIVAGTLTIGGAGLLGGGNYATSIVNNGALNYASSVAQTNSGVISGVGNLTAAGSGSLTLSGNNTYGGLTLVTNGLLRAQSANALGTPALGTVVAAGGTLELAGANASTLAAGENLELRGTLSTKVIGTNTYAGNIWLYDGSSIDVGPNSALFLSLSTQDIGSNTNYKTGSGLLRFVGDPNHRSVFVVADGTVELAAASGLSTDAPWIINSGATLREITVGALGDFFIQADGTLDMQGTDQFGGLAGSGLVTNSGASAVTVTVGANNQSGVFSGVIRNGGTGTVGLTKTQSGVLTLSGASTYSGGTTLSGGQLNINNGGSGGTSSAIGSGPFTISGYTLDNTSGSDITLSPVITQSWGGDFTFIGSKSLNLGTGAVTLTGNRTVTVLTNTLAVGGAVGGGYSLTKNGAGTLALFGANTYSGATTVNNGILLINGSTVASSAVTVNSGATLGGSGTITGTVTVALGGLLAPGGINATNTLTLANNSATSLTLNGNTLLFDLPASGTDCDKINITGASGKLVLNGTNTIALSFPYGGAAAGNYTLMTCAGGITTNAAGAALVLLPGAYPNATLSVIGNDVVLTTTASITGLTWTGSGTGSWDGADPDLNWTSNSVAVAFAAGNAVTFDDTASRFSVTSGGAVAPASVLFNNSVNDYDVSAAISGTGPLVKMGTDTTTLSGVSAYNPASITVNAGMLTFGGASQLNGGSYAGNIFNNGALNYASSAAQTYSGTISGGGTLTSSGSGSLTLSGSNFYSGVTLVNAGVLKMQHAYALGTTGAGTTVAPGATLALAGDINTLGEALTLNGTLASPTGSNTFNGAVTLNTGASIDVGTGSTLILKVFTANGPFAKTGSGWLRFTTDPNGTGTMSVNEGVAELAQAGGAMDANVVVNAGATFIGNWTDAINAANQVAVNAGGLYVLRQSDTINGLIGAGTVSRDIGGTATLTVANNNAQLYTFSGVIQNGSGTMAFTKSGYGNMALTGVNTYSGATTVNGGTLLVNSPGSLAAGSAVTVSATLGGNGTVNGPVTMAASSFLTPGGLSTIGTLALGSTLALNGVTLLCDVPASVTAPDQVAVTGALTLNGTNTVALSFPAGATPVGDYTLMTFASRSGTGSFVLSCNYPNASLETTATSLILHVSGSGTSALMWNGNVSAIWDGGIQNWEIGAAPASYNSGDAVTFDDTAASFTVNSGSAVTPSFVLFNNNVNTYTVGASIGGTAQLAKFGMGTASLNGVSTYNPGSITVSAGTLALGSASRLNSGTYAGNIANSGVFNYNSTAAQTNSGVISGVGSVTKSNTGSLTLSGANTHSGGTTVSAGTLYGRTSATAFGTGGLTLNGGIAELQNDTGLAFANNVTVSASTTVKSGRLAAGAGVTHSLGTLNIGNQTMTVTNGANVNANSPYGLTLGTVTLSSSTATFDVANNGTGLGTLTLGALGGNYNLTKQGVGTLFFGVAGGRSSGTTTLSAGTLKLGQAAALGTTGTALALNGGTLDLANDTTVNAYNTTVGGNTTVQSDKATAGSAGITHSLGTLSIGAFTLTVTNGTNVRALSPYGLTFGATTLTAAPVFDVGNNGTGLGTLSLGVVGGNFALTKRGTGTLKLTGVNGSTGAMTVNNGRVLGVSGGSSASSAVTVQSSGYAGAAARLGVLCNAANAKWTCSSLLTTNAVSPATAAPVLEFTFSVAPSTTTAPLQVTGTAILSTNTGVTVILSNLASVPTNTYPLMAVGGTAPSTTPALTMVGGYSGSTLLWSGNTLYLILAGTPDPIRWNTGAAGGGTWDVNNSTNTVWKDSSAASTFYQEATGPGITGDRVLFDDTFITTNTTITLNSLVTPTSVAFTNAAFSFTLVGTGTIAGTIGLAKSGSNTVTLAIANTYSGGTTVGEGTLRVASGGSISHSAANVVAGTSLFTNALLKIESGALVSGKWLQAGTTNGAAGAVHNQGTFVIAGATGVDNFALGYAVGGYGYYRHDSSIPLTMGETGIASANGGNGVFDVLQGAVTNSTYFQLNRGAVQQYGQVNVTGGRLIMPNNAGNAHFFYGGFGQAVINVSGGGLLGSAGTATELDLIKNSTSNNAIGVLNILSAGTVQATRIKATQAAGTALVNFNGGTLKANYSVYNTAALLGGTAIDRATIFAQGATVDTDGKDVFIAQPLMAPTGNSVTSIPVLTNGVGYIGRPVVYITGGGGTGATAIAEFDPTSQQVTGITITSPGFGYTTAPAVTITGGGGSVPTLDLVAIGPVASGGLTKNGTGMLTLYCTNTYSGVTTISNGTLRLGVANALPTNAPVTVAGGIFDLNGFTVTNNSITLLSGSIINGKIVAPALQGADAGILQAQLFTANGLTKNGADTLTIATPQAYLGATTINSGTLRLLGRQPGLYEGRVANSFELTTPNPKTAVVTSTRYANLYFATSAASGGVWLDNTTYIYTGYLWNDAATNETWTFFRCFDDSTRIMVNGVNVLQNQASGAIVTSNATVNAGWNTFELRLGQGIGAVGNNNVAWPSMGVGYDRMGRNQQVYANFKTLVDPGDGSLLTLTNLYDLASANLLPTNSAVTVAANAVLDLGGTGQRLGGLSGSGVVSNGTLTVNGMIAPGGINATGTLTLATSSATLTGTLRIDVSSDGSCDVLAVKGNVNLSGLALTIEDPGQLTDRHLQYTILTCTGSRTGTFSSKNLPSGWTVLYQPNGDVKLVYMGGTLIRLL